jgi:HK97 family phage major capsid protein
MEINNQSVEALSQALIGQLKSNLDQRDAALCERLAKQLDEKLEAQRREADAKAARFAVPGLAQDSKEVKEFSFAKLIGGLMKGNVAKFAPLEYEMCSAAAGTVDSAVVTKDMVTTVDSLGGFIVPNQVMSAQIIPLLQAAVVAFEAGTVRMSGLSGSPVQIPKITGATTAYWLGEVEAVTNSDMTFGQIDLYPHDVFALCTLSNRLIELGAPGAEQLVRTQLARDIGLKIDAAVFNGTGAAGQPIGIYNTSGVNSYTWTTSTSVSASTAYGHLLGMEKELYLDNAQTVGEFVWAVHPTLFNSLRNMVDPGNPAAASANVQPKNRPFIDAGKIERIIGHRYVISTQLPTDKLLLGAFASSMVAEWGTMVLAASREGTNFTKRQTQILAGMTVDVGVRYPEAFVASTVSV